MAAPALPWRQTRKDPEKGQKKEHGSAKDKVHSCGVFIVSSYYTVFRCGCFYCEGGEEVVEVFNGGVVGSENKVAGGLGQNRSTVYCCIIKPKYPRTINPRLLHVKSAIEVLGAVTFVKPKIPPNILINFVQNTFQFRVLFRMQFRIVLTF